MKRTGFLFLTLSLILAACGTVAAPVFQADLENTQVAEAATSVAETANAPTATATFTITPSPTATEPPTATPTATETVPPTETPLPTKTEVPTKAPASDNIGEVTGDPTVGEEIFHTFQAQANFACATCHLTDSENTLIGPGLKNVGIRAQTRIPGMTAVEYIHQSIVDPSAYVVEGFPDNLMPHVFGDIFTEEQIQDLIAYLMTL